MDHNPIYGRGACVNYTPTQGKQTHLNVQLDQHGQHLNMLQLKRHLTSSEVKISQVQVVFPF